MVEIYFLKNRMNVVSGLVFLKSLTEIRGFVVELSCLIEQSFFWLHTNSVIGFFGRC